MATITKRNGRYKCQVRVRGWPSRSGTFDSRREAEKWGREQEADLTQPAPGYGAWRGLASARRSPWTIKDILDKYVQEESPKKRSGKGDKGRARTLIATLGSYTTQTLENQHLSAYKKARLELRKPQTVLHDLALLHRACVIAEQDWGCHFPKGVPRTSRPVLDNQRVVRINPAQVDMLVRAAWNPVLKLLIPFAVETAMRRSELIGLDWSRVNLDRSTVLLIRTKNGKPRTVPLSPKAISILRSVRCLFGPPSPFNSDGQVFQITLDNCSHGFERARVTAGLLGIRFHDLRHEAISRLFERGLNVLEVSRISGHRTLSMLDRYTHLDVDYLVRKLAA